MALEGHALNAQLLNAPSRHKVSTRMQISNRDTRDATLEHCPLIAQIQVLRPLQAGSLEGTVVDIGLHSTHLVDQDKHSVVVPNSYFSNQVRRTFAHRSHLFVSISRHQIWTEGHRQKRSIAFWCHPLADRSSQPT
jgi:hypothetical protein